MSQDNSENKKGKLSWKHCVVACLVFWGFPLLINYMGTKPENPLHYQKPPIRSKLQTANKSAGVHPGTLQEKKSLVKRFLQGDPTMSSKEEEEATKICADYNNQWRETHDTSHGEKSPLIRYLQGDPDPLSPYQPQPDGEVGIIVLEETETTITHHSE